MDEWIYCEDRLPDNIGEYDVTIIPNYSKEPCVRVFLYNGKNYYGRPIWMQPTDDNDSFFTTLANVIAWKPCSKPAEVRIK